MIARRSMSVFSTRPPLAGQPSTAAKLSDGGAVEGSAAVDASHAGPLEYWVLAVPYRALAWTPAGLLLAVDWLDLLRSDLPAPYPPTGLSAWLVPA